MRSCRKEAEEVMFSVVRDVLQATGLAAKQVIPKSRAHYAHSS